MLLKRSHGDTHDARMRRWKALRMWHRWFAWFPVPVSHDHMAWLQHVNRRLHPLDDRPPDDGWPARRYIYAIGNPEPIMNPEWDS
jgi:hypothetical protein